MPGGRSRTRPLARVRELVLELEADADVHADEFLDEELGGVGHSHLGDAAGGTAGPAVALVAEEAAALADVDLGAVGADHEALQ